VLKRLRIPLVLLAIGGTLGTRASVRAQTPAEVARGREVYAEAVAAYRAGDHPVFLAAIERADALRPAHPGILYALASARSLSGDPAGAVETLVRLADMGLAYDPTADEDFAALADDPGFADAAARLAANGGPAGVADSAFTLPWPDFVPEGIARDPDSGAFFVSGVHGRRVVRIDADGRAEPFVEGLWSALGLAVDPARRILWIGTAAIRETADVDSTEIGRGAVIGVDLDTSRRVAELLLPDNGSEHVPGDLSVTADGTLFVSDAAAGTLWVLRPGAEALDVLVGPDALVSPQGSALSADGRTLWLADYSLGILAVDPATGAARRLRQPADAALLGIDALLLHGDDLIAVQNGVRPARVLRLRVDPHATELRSWEILAAGLPAFEEPTGATVVGGRLYLIANSHWDRFEDGRLPDPASLSLPLVLSIALDPPSAVMLEN
jgi:sugar lactone lactonase YvrE